MHAPTPKDIRSARAYLGWTQKELGEKCGMSSTAIANIEKELSVPTKKHLEKIQQVFNNEDIEFAESGGFIRYDDLSQVIDGKDSYLSVLEDVYLTLKGTKGEFLISGCDDRRSPPEVIAWYRDVFRKEGFKFRMLVRDGDTYLQGRLEEYRWMPKGLFVDSDCKVIYGDRLVYTISWKNVRKAIVIKDHYIAEEARRTFNYIWNISKRPTHSTSDIRF